MTLRIRPGEYINEAILCDTIGIARTPVHHALQRLMHEGLVRIIPRKGVIVSSVTLDEVLDVIDVRYLNEPYCVELATDAASAADIDKMTELLESAPALIAAHDVEALMLLDRAFHCAIARAAGNTVLADILSGLHDRSLRFWVISLSDPERMQTVQNEHLRIVDAIRARDRSAAKAAMQAHIKSFRAAISKRVR